MKRIMEKLKKVVNAVTSNELKINFILLTIAAIIYAIGYCLDSLNKIVLALVIAWMNNLLHGILHIKEKVYFFFFNVTLGLFLISRPVIIVLQGRRLVISDFSSTIFALNAVICAVIGLFIGAQVYDLLKEEGYFAKWKNKMTKKESAFSKNRKTIAEVSFSIVIISFIARMIIEVQKYIFMMGKTYVELYTEYSSQIPVVLQAASTLFEVAMCVYLLTSPKKKVSYFVLILYVVQTVPGLLIGLRSEFVSAVIFAFLYVVYRSIQKEEKEIWFGKFEKTLTILSIPVVLITLGAYNYIRDGKDLPTINPATLMEDFFYKQGVSFATVCKSNFLKRHLDGEDKNYTFGGIIDYIKYENAITKQIFKEDGLGAGNNRIKALEGNSLAHALSYWDCKWYYLDGHGLGSSFVIETYLDYGYVGIIVYSLLLGIFLNLIMPIFNLKNFLSVYVIVSTLKIFLVPRSEATGFLQCIIQVHFWLPIIAIVMGVIILGKLPKLKEKFDFVFNKLSIT